MQFPVLYSLASLLTLSQITQAARVIKLTKTVDNTVTNTNVVEGTVSTFTDWLTNTRTTTTTRYTSTYTSTIFGQPHTYVSVVNSEIEQPAAPQETGQEAPQDTQQTQQQPEETQAQETQPQETQAQEKPAETLTAPPSTAPAPSPAPSPAPTSTSTTDEEELVETVAGDEHSSLEPGFVLDSVLTSTNDGVCYVDYEYYDATSTETVTSTSTLTSTITV